MRLRHIEVFHAIYTTGSITNAAKLLHVSQPSVSKVLSHAELQLGFKLFDRIKGRLIATREAELLFLEVDRLNSQMSLVNSVAENIKNNQLGRICIGSTPALGFDLIPSTIAKFRQTHAEVKFNVQTLHHEQLLSHLLQLKSEVAIMFSPEKFSGINEHYFTDAQLVVVYPKELLPHEPSKIALSELVDFPMISISESGPLAMLLAERLQMLDINLQETINVQTYFIAVSLVKYCIGVCIVDEFTARGQTSDDVCIAELIEPITFPVKALYLENKPLSNVANKFLEVMDDVLKQSTQ